MDHHPDPGDRAGAVRRTLADLVSRHGASLLEDSRRVRAMLADAVSGATAEANLVGLALSAGVPDRLREATGSGLDPARAIDSVAGDLERTSSVQTDDARWVVSTVAEALGLTAATAPRAARPAPAAVAPMADAGAGQAHTTPGTPLVVRAGGREHRAAPGTVVTLGREPGGTLALDSTAVSRRHASLAQGPDGRWTFTDLDSTQGSFHEGRRIRTLTLDSAVDVVLGQGPDAVTVSLLPPVSAGAAPGRPGVGAPGHPVPADVTQRPAVRPVAVPAAATEVGAPAASALSLTLAGRTRTLAPGTVLSIGREADNDLVSDVASVSRRHLRIEHRGGSWHAVDLGSSSGTWHEGRRVEDHVVAGRQTLVLGDPDRGERLQVETAGGGATAAGPLHRISSRGGGRGGGRGGRRVPLLAAAAVVLVLGLVTAGYLLWPSAERETPTAAAPLSPDELARGTVYLEWSDANQTVSGSGTIVDKERGLILTNAHVVAPAALGSGVRDGYRIFSAAVKNPREVDVSIADGIGKPVQPRFTATVVAADGYLDLAVLKIQKTTSGGFVEPEDLASLTEVPLGDSDGLEPTDELTVIGYPSAQGSLGSTYGPAVVSGWTGDERIGTNRAEINSTAQVAHGNSGGLAADDEGRLVAVPTLLRADNLAPLGEQPDYTTVGSALRPINLAKPLIEAAQADEEYKTPWTSPKPRGAKILGVSADVFVEPGDDGSIGPGCNADTATYPTWAFGVRYRGFSGGEHTDVLAVLTDPETGDVIDYAVTPWRTELARSGCLTITTSLRTLPEHVAMTIAVGGDVEPVWERVLW